MNELTVYSVWLDTQRFIAICSSAFPMSDNMHPACQEGACPRFVEDRCFGLFLFSRVALGGVDIICAQGGEGGGHTGSTPFSILIPAIVDMCKGATSPLTGEPVMVIAAGGIADGRGLAASLSCASVFLLLVFGAVG